MFKILARSRGVAPPLTDMWVVRVESILGGRENLTGYEYITQFDHGGNVLQVITCEIGYKATNSATFMGNKMRYLQSSPIDIDGDRIYDGFLYLWESNFSFTTGQFFSESTSANAPQNTLSTNIRIR